MDGNVMADPDSESYFQSDTLGLRHISSSLFNIPGFLVGFSTKGSSDSDMVRSPTSPLDLRVFANFSNPFSVRSPRSSSQSGYQKKWDCSKMGLGIVNLLADEIKSDGEDLDSPKRKNIIFGPQVKTKFPSSSRYSHEFLGNSMKSNSLPRNYIISQLSKDRKPNTNSGGSSLVFGNEEVPLEPKSDSSRLSPSFIASTKNCNLSSRSFCSENGTTSLNSSSLPIGRALQVDDSLLSKPSSLPIPVGHSIGSLSAHEIELSEDYTCIISHGPNPKTTHIFGDCILECHNTELTNFDKKAEPETKVSQLDKSPETSTPYPSDEFLSFCYSCQKKLEKDEDIYMYRGEKAFCSFDCRSEEIFAEEMEKTCNNSFNGSPEQSDDEDLFLMAMDDRSINHESWIAKHRV
ncbi:Pre-mRNA cleavage complex 2 protein Pcf11, putative isoform 3 [Theobroma cacao]|uniref:Pre-mRNA cleavage complex 2 protein Pcf11, putative isoform 3 n=1 Tax=Theobroma cacao TaxID=3641 RepID=A0A061GI45_THECC|nr:Pre-mRNA cleavage complex 2 protein Pcf11, putative isoform 3 [Theobroma cacao]